MCFYLIEFFIIQANQNSGYMKDAYTWTGFLINIKLLEILGVVMMPRFGCTFITFAVRQIFEIQ